MNENLENNELFDLLNRYFAGDASAKDVDHIKNWLKESPENQQLYDQYKILWDNLEKYRISQVINVDDEWNSFKSGLKDTKTASLKPDKKLSPFIRFVRYAAVIILFLMVGSVGYYLVNKAGQERYVAKTEINEIALPDESKITLNKNSKIIVSKDFNEIKREVKLIGEAYFEVNPTDKPFIVKTPDIEIEVLGTSFLVNAIKKKGEVEVIVNSGTVSVTQRSDRSKKVILKAGEKANFRKKTEELKKLENKDANFLSWKTRKLIFKNDKLYKVVKTLNKMHNTSIVIETKAIKKCRLTASFDNQSLESILKVIESTLDIEVIKQKDKIILRGEGC